MARNIENAYLQKAKYGRANVPRFVVVVCSKMIGAIRCCGTLLFFFSHIYIYIYAFFLLFYMDVASYMRMETSWAIPNASTHIFCKSPTNPPTQSSTHTSTITCNIENTLFGEATHGRDNVPRFVFDFLTQ